MKTQASLLRSAALLGTLAACGLAFAQGGARTASQEQKYRCEVLGDSTACPMGSLARDASIPGPYAQYLINKGVPREEALDAAKQVGEVPLPAPGNVDMQTQQ